MNSYIIIYFTIYGILFLYHAYTYIGISIFSLQAFKFGKKIKTYHNINMNYENFIESLTDLFWKYNNTLHKKHSKTLIYPQIGFFSYRNSMRKLRIIITNKDQNYDIDIYYDPFSNFLSFMFIYFIPYIFTFEILYTSNKLIDILLPLKILLFFLIPYIIIIFFSHRKFKRKVLEEIDIIVKKI